MWFGAVVRYKNKLFGRVHGVWILFSTFFIYFIYIKQSRSAFYIYNTYIQGFIGTHTTLSDIKNLGNEVWL